MSKQLSANVWGTLVLMGSFFLGLGGCATVAFKQAPNPVEVDVSEYPRMFQAAAEELRAQGFGVQIEDYRLGTLTSRTHVAPSIMEFWRPGNTTRYQKIRSTLNEQRRRVTIQFTPDPREPVDNPQTYQLQVTVMVEQQQVPIRQLTGSTSGHNIFASLSKVPAELEQKGISPTYWYPIGRDPYLEQQLIRGIVRRSLTIELPEEDQIHSPANNPLMHTRSPDLKGLDKP